MVGTKHQNLVSLMFFPSRQASYNIHKLLVLFGCRHKRPELLDQCLERQISRSLQNMSHFVCRELCRHISPGHSRRRRLTTCCLIDRLKQKIVPRVILLTVAYWKGFRSRWFRRLRCGFLHTDSAFFFLLRCLCWLSLVFRFRTGRRRNVFWCPLLNQFLQFLPLFVELLMLFIFGRVTLKVLFILSLHLPTERRLQGERDFERTKPVPSLALQNLLPYAHRHLPRLLRTPNLQPKANRRHLVLSHH